MSSITARGVRRFFQYAVLYALLLVTAIGASDLLARAFGVDYEQWEDPDALLARSLAFVIVGGAVSATLLWGTRRSHHRDAAEGRSLLFTIYLTLAALTGAIAFTGATQELVSALVGDGAVRPAALAGVIVWATFWLLHRYWARRALDARRDTPHLLLGSLYGLSYVAAGLTQLLGAALDVFLRPDVFGHRLGGLGTGAGLLVAGGIVWGVYWLASGIRLPRRTFWLVYVLPFGVGGGLVMALVAASRLVWSVLVWFLGDRLGAPAAEHFDSAAVEIAALLVGVLLWWYHRSVLGDVGRSEPRRVYEYLVSGIALVAAALGVGTVIVALIESATPGIDIGMTVLNTLWAAVTLLAVGVPVWWIFWRRIQSATAADPQPEIASLSRRIYVVLLFGLAAVAAVIALITVAMSFFGDLVEGVLGATTLRSMRYGLGTLVAAGAVAVYHWAVFRHDRSVAEAAPRQEGPRSVLLVAPDDADGRRRVARATGAELRFLSRLDVTPSAWDADAVVAALEGRDGQDLVVLVGPDECRVVPVTRA